MGQFKWLIIFVIVILAIIVGGVIFSQSYKPPQKSESQIETEIPSPKLQATTSVIPEATRPASLSLREISLTATSFSFNPATIKLKKGEKVRLVVKNIDIRHTFTVKELGIEQNLPAGQTTTFELTPEKTGTFTFYCAVPGHKASGMEGKIIVE